jgi:hypothetical protein
MITNQIVLVVLLGLVIESAKPRTENDDENEEKICAFAE